MVALIHRFRSKAIAQPHVEDTRATTGEEIQDGHLRYVGAKAANDSPESYQEASGAPVEAVSPLGLNVGSV